MAKSILIIEDDVIQREIVERILRGAGYRVLSAADGEAGLAAAAAAPPDRVVLGVMMTRQNGYQTAPARRRAPATADRPILMLTSKDEATDHYWAAEVGVNAYLTKPPESQSLLQTVRGLIGAP